MIFPTFLAPGTAAVAAAFALPALIALYLLKLRRRPVRVSSTVLWEDAARDLEVNTPLKWITPTVLFFLHALIVLLFVAAIGRPAMDAGGLGAATRVVLVIDRSASMQAGDGGTGDDIKSRLDRAKEEAATIIADLGRGVGGVAVGCVTFAAEPSVLIGMTPDLRLVRDEIARVRGTDQPGDIAAAMKVVASLVSPEGSEETAAAGTVVIILSDGSISTERPLSAGGAEIRFVRCGPAVAAAAAKLPNLGVAALAARRDDATPSTLRVFSRVVNASSAPASATVTLAFSGEVVDRRAVTVPASDAESAGGVGVTFEIVKPQAGIVTVNVSGGDGDLLASDNSASVVVAAALRPTVLFVTAGAASGAADGLSAQGLLKDVLSELPLEKLENVTPSTLTEMLADGRATSYDLIVLDRTDLSVLPAVPTLAIASSLPSAGLSLGPASGDGAGGAAAGYALAWKRTHPVLRDVSLDTVYVGRTRGFVDVPQDAASAVKLDDLARGKSGSFLRVSEDGGVRRLAMSFEVAQTNWALEPGFAIFLSSAVEFLTGRNAESAAVSFTTGTRFELVSVVGKPGATDGAANSAQLEGPESIPVSFPPGSPRVIVGPLELAGVYTTGAVPGVAAVNLTDERESRLATRDSIEVAGRAAAVSTGEAGSREVWPWLVMLAGVLLVAEWVIYGLRSRVV